MSKQILPWFKKSVIVQCLRSPPNLYFSGTDRDWWVFSCLCVHTTTLAAPFCHVCTLWATTIVTLLHGSNVILTYTYIRWTWWQIHTNALNSHNFAIFCNRFNYFNWDRLKTLRMTDSWLNCVVFGYKKLSFCSPEDSFAEHQVPRVSAKLFFYEAQLCRLSMRVFIQSMIDTSAYMDLNWSRQPAVSVQQACCQREGGPL